MRVKQVRKFIKRNNRVASVKVKPTPVVTPKAEPKPAKVEEKPAKVEEKKVEEPKSETKNNKQKKEDMTLEQIEKAEVLAQNLEAPQKVKVVKKDRGLIERTESSKIVLTEDNRQVLTD